MSKENYRGIWVYIEQADHQAQHVGLELLHAARDLADTTGEELTAVILADDTTELVEQVKPYGADSILAVDCPQCAQYVTDVYTELLHGLICEYKPSAVLIGATENGRDFAPRVSCRLKTGLTADCTALGIDAESGDVAWTRPAFGGNLMATILCSNTRPQIGTVRPGVFRAQLAGKATEKVIRLERTVTQDKIRTQVRWARPVRQWTPAGSTAATRSDRRAAPFTPSCTSPAAFLAQFSIWQACPGPTRSWRSTRIPTRRSSRWRISVLWAICLRSFLH